MKHPKALEILETYWGYKEFRGFQSNIIDSILDGTNTIGLLPTGGGKSICYQVPGLLYQGFTLVISPLIALMMDQHQGLIDKGIKSFHFHGSYSNRELDTAFQNLRHGGYKFAFLAPERLSNPLFQEYLKNADVGLIAIDEAHCISQWGFDFRPSYLNIHLLRELLPEVPVLALTASATPRVKKDLAEQLRIADAVVFEGSLRRSNLGLHLKFSPNKERQLLRLLDRLQGAGIIYAKTRRVCEQLSELLNAEGYHAGYFHAGLEQRAKEGVQNRWISNELPIIVATTAFGMGIDKSDVQWVIHWDVPDTLEGYYQEVGRGGRAGQEAQAYLLFHQYDVSRLQKAIDELPNPDEVVHFYNSFCSKHQIAEGAGENEIISFKITDLAVQFNLGIKTVLEYIRLLQQRGLWQFIESQQAFSTLQILLPHEQWGKLETSHQQILLQIFRLYPNCQEESVRINVERVSALLQVLPKDLSAILQALTKRKVVAYAAEIEMSAVQLTTDRPMKKYFKLPKSFIDSWIESKRERTLAMLEFLSKEECVFKQIESYFGQEQGASCGKCSYCTREYYPDPEVVKSMLHQGLTLDDIWFDLNCTPDELKA
jgi:ATP-dependent DNA helicase RecQ